MRLLNHFFIAGLIVFSIGLLGDGAWAKDAKPNDSKPQKKEKKRKLAYSFRVRFPSHGRHVEANLTTQRIALIEGKEVQYVYRMSSGTSVTPTVTGSFRFYNKTPGLNMSGMYFSSFFIRGYAVHGYHVVPRYPASHGCLRIGMPVAKHVYGWINIGDRIDVFH